MYAQDSSVFLGCNPAYFNADVRGKFEDKDVTINIGGSYDLSEAFNISKEALKQNFSLSVVDNSGNWVSTDYDNWAMTGQNKGMAEFKVWFGQT